MATKPKFWTEDEDEKLKSMYLAHERSEIACALGRTKASIRKRCSVLGLNYKHPAVTDDEMSIIKEWYESKIDYANEEFDLVELSNKLGRTRNFICRLAGRMGLTIRDRHLGDLAKENMSKTMRRIIATNGHPRGMLGKKHTEEFKEKQSIRVKSRKRTAEQEKIRIDKMMRTKIAKYGSGNPGSLTSSNPYSRTKSGKRKDLNNRFFRSSWEANYARYLNWLIANGQIARWEYECKTFLFHGVTRGEISYTPDFKVYENDGSYSWHEVKGWMDAKSKSKLKKMSKFYPEEKVVLIDAKVYRSLSKWKGMIDNWE